MVRAALLLIFGAVLACAQNTEIIDTVNYAGGGPASGRILITGQNGTDTVSIVAGALVVALPTGLYTAIYNLNDGSTYVQSWAVPPSGTPLHVSDVKIPLGSYGTSSNALTATALAGTPYLCPSGQAPVGIIPNGNASGCTAYQLPLTTGSVDSVLNGTLGLTAIANCTAAGGVIQYSTTSHTITCHTLVSGDIPALPYQSPLTTGSVDSLFNGTLGLTAIANCTAAGGVIQYSTTSHTITCHTLVASDIPPVNALASPSLGAGASPVTETWTVGAGGVTANTLVATDGSAPLKIVAATSGAYGIAMSTVAATGTVEVARYGTVNCITDTGGATAGDLAVVGTGTVIDCKDSGQTSSSAISTASRIIGVFRSSATAGNPALVELTPAHFGTNLVSGLGYTPLAPSNNLSDVSNAATALTNLNGVSQSGNYTNPSWISSLSWNKLTGLPTLISAMAGWSDVGFSRTAAGALKLTNASSGYGTMDAGNFTIQGFQVAIVQAATTAGCVSTFYDTGTYVYCPNLSAKIDSSGDLTLPGTATICSGCTGTGGFDLKGGTSGLSATIQANPSTTTYTFQIPAGVSTTHAVNNSGTTTPLLYDPGTGAIGTSDNLVVNCFGVGAALLSACNSYTANQLGVGNATNGILAMIQGAQGNIQLQNGAANGANTGGCYTWNSGTNAAASGADTFICRGAAGQVNIGQSNGARTGAMALTSLILFGGSGSTTTLTAPASSALASVVSPTTGGTGSTMAVVAAANGQPACSDVSGAAAHCGTAANELTSGTVAAARLPNSTVMATVSGNSNGTCAAASVCYARLNATGTTLNVSSYVMPQACVLRNLWVYINAGTSCAPASCSAWTGILQFELFDDANSETVLNTTPSSSGGGDTGIGGNSSTWASPGNTCNSGAICFLPNATAGHLSDTTNSHTVNAGDLIVLAMQNNMTNGTTGQTSATLGAWGFTCGAN